MSSIQRTHHVTTTDGVTIAATVHGEGSPLVLLHGADNDGDLGWQEVRPHLTDRFSCHLLDNRGRGLSGDHPDLSIPRLAQDVLEYVDSIGEPAGLVGDSLGANLARLVAAQSDEVDAIACFEPAMMSLLDATPRTCSTCCSRRWSPTAQRSITRPCSVRSPFRSWP